MCINALFRHTCGHCVPLEGGLERCNKAEEARAERCDDVTEEEIEDAYPCRDCSEKREEADVEEQVRLAMVASANDFANKEGKEGKEQMRTAMAASISDETQRARVQEEREMEIMLQKSMQGVSLEDKWEIDPESDGMAQILRESYAAYRQQQENEFRKRGFLEEGVGLPEGEWTRRETIHDRVAPGSITSGGGGRGGECDDYPGPSRTGPALAHTSLRTTKSETGKERDTPPQPPRQPTKRLQEYPPNIGPLGYRHPLLLKHYISCSHDIPAGIDYSGELSANEINAVRTPVSGKCAGCGGKAAPPVGGEGRERDDGVATESEPKPKPSPEPELEAEVETQSQLSPTELRAKRLAAITKG